MISKINSKLKKKSLNTTAQNANTNPKGEREPSVGETNYAMRTNQMPKNRDNSDSHKEMAYSS